MVVDPEAEFELLPVWAVNDWGAPMPQGAQHLASYSISFAPVANRVSPLASARGIAATPVNLASHLLTTRRRLEQRIDAIQQTGLMEHILYCDLCNEWPLRMWCPYFYGQDVDAAAAGGQGQALWSDEHSMNWLRATADITAAHPDLSVTTSLHLGRNEEQILAASEFCDFFEPHLWMANGDFYHRLGWTFSHKWDRSLNAR